MSLTKDFIQSQVNTLGKHTRETLKELNDEGLTERTLVYRNLREVGRINGQKDSDVIAQTIVDILDTRAWEDFVDVDGSRRSCESFSKWLELHGLDIQLAEFVIKEKRIHALSKFYDARDGKVVSMSDAASLRWKTKEDGLASQTAQGVRRKVTAAYFLQRLTKDAESSSKASELLSGVLSKSISITKASEEMGYQHSRATKLANNVVNRLFPQAKPIIKKLGIAPEEFVKRALEEYIANHPEFTDD